MSKPDICRVAGLLAVALWLGAGAARAALPDPVRFSITAELGDLRSLRAWLDEGLAPDFLGDRIGSGLMIGAWEGNVAMMELFLARGANVHQLNRHGEQALQLAAWKGQLEAVRWLLDRGAAVNRAGKQWSALHYAAFAGHRAVVELLVARGADVNARSPNDSTALMMAAREGQEAVAGLLLDAGAELRSTNDWGESALDVALRNRHFRVAKALATPAQFADAVKAAPVRAAAPVKSVPAPARVSELLEALRRAQAEGRPTAALRREFLAEVARFKGEANRIEAVPSALVITAGRGGGGERAQLQYGAAEPGSAADLVQQIRRAEAAGKPSAALRRQLMETVARHRREAQQP